MTITKDWYEQLSKKFEKFVNLGTDDSMDFVVQKRIRTINLSIFICLPLISGYWLLSFLTHHFLLAKFYLLLILLLVIMLYCNYLKKGESYRIGILVVLVVTMSIAGIIFNNGQEFYVLLIALLSILFYDLRKKQLYLSISYAVVFVANEILTFFVQPIEQAPVIIKIVNIIVVLFILFYFLYDIKKVYIKFLQEIIDEKQHLELSNTLLVQQAITLELKNKSIEDLKDKNDELSSIVYHQLRSPVAAFADILSQYLESSVYTKEEFYEMSKHLQNKVTNTLGVVDNLLQWNKKGVESIEPKALMCEINKIVQRALLQLQPQFDKKKLIIDYTKPEKTLVYADADHVLIVLQNVLTNAIKFSPPNGHIKIDISNLCDMCRVNVTNNGKGISKDRLKELFSTRHIVSAKGAMNEKGTGLGLKICKKLIEKNNGTIKIESEENKKTSVLIDLPTGLN